MRGLQRNQRGSQPQHPDDLAVITSMALRKKARLVYTVRSCLSLRKILDVPWERMRATTKITLHSVLPPALGEHPSISTSVTSSPFPVTLAR
jgi:hypothetical protein